MNLICVFSIICCSLNLIAYPSSTLTSNVISERECATTSEYVQIAQDMIESCEIAYDPIGLFLALTSTKLLQNLLGECCNTASDEIITCFVHNGCNLNKKINTAQFTTLIFGECSDRGEEFIKKLGHSTTLLRIWIEFNEEHIVESLIQHGAIVSKQDLEFVAQEYLQLEQELKRSAQQKDSVVCLQYSIASMRTILKTIYAASDKQSQKKFRSKHPSLANIVTQS